MMHLCKVSGVTQRQETGQQQQASNQPARRVLAAARGFVAAHGKPVRAVVEHTGRHGARVVLVGADGVLGDVMVPTVEAGEALLAAVEHVRHSTWDHETTEALTIGPAHRRRMAGPRARR